jgi:RnfABCDGE-type electron transport complex B subunit
MIVIAIVGMGIIALVLGVALALASKRFVVKEDPQVEKVYGVLPKVNCGACGFPNCLEFAKAVLKDKDLATHCRVGRQKTADDIAQVLGIEIMEEEPSFARVHCKGGKHAKDKHEYHGIETCQAASLVANGPKLCDYACLGFGDCVKACKFDAIEIGKDGLPSINKENCTGCGACVKACPRSILELTKKSHATIIACSSRDPARHVTQSCRYGCIACGTCVRECPVKAIVIKDNLAVVDHDRCIHCGKCARVCPRKTIDIGGPK